MKVLSLLTLSLLISACTIGYSPRYYYSNIVVANISGETLRNLKVQVGQGRSLECAEVTDKRLCQQRFGKRPYPQESVVISWQSSDGQQQMQQVNPSVPLTLTPSLAIRLMIEIGADASL